MGCGERRGGRGQDLERFEREEPCWRRWTESRATRIRGAARSGETTRGAARASIGAGSVVERVRGALGVRARRLSSFPARSPRAIETRKNPRNSARWSSRSGRRRSPRDRGRDDATVQTSWADVRPHRRARLASSRPRVARSLRRGGPPRASRPPRFTGNRSLAVRPGDARTRDAREAAARTTGRDARRGDGVARMVGGWTYLVAAPLEKGERARRWMRKTLFSRLGLRGLAGFEAKRDESELRSLWNTVTFFLIFIYFSLPSCVNFTLLPTHAPRRATLLPRPSGAYQLSWHIANAAQGRYRWRRPRRGRAAQPLREVGEGTSAHLFALRASHPPPLRRIVPPADATAFQIRPPDRRSDARRSIRRSWARSRRAWTRSRPPASST